MKIPRPVFYFTFSRCTQIRHQNCNPSSYNFEERSKKLPHGSRKLAFLKSFAMSYENSETSFLFYFFEMYPNTLSEL